MKMKAPSYIEHLGISRTGFIYLNYEDNFPFEEKKDLGLSVKCHDALFDCSFSG